VRDSLRRQRLLHWFVLIVVVSGALALTGVGGAIALEQNNEFCAACHTEPEVTFVRRFAEAKRDGLASTLAAAHALATDGRPDGVLCIDCHGGVGVRGRAESLALALRDTYAFITGDFEQPAKMDKPLPDEVCIQCHRTWADDRSFENHIHWYFLEEGAPTTIRCVDCHVSHMLGNEFEFFISREVVFPQCEACHKFMGRGPTQMTP